VNRIICDHLSALLFVPSAAGIQSLEAENIRHRVREAGMADYNKQGVFFTGDIMYDNTLYFAAVAGKKAAAINEKYSLPKMFILLTMHRPSNVDSKESLNSILTGIKTVVEEHDQQIVFPVHPRTRGIIESDPALKALIQSFAIQLIPPVSFIEMIHLENSASLIITDSGGVQKEAYFLEKPCIIMLDETPWTELVDSGMAILTGNSGEKIISAYNRLSNQALFFDKGLYGDGKAAEFIVAKILEHLKTRTHA
jgi:UDP-GlcNAc3NAcA epimerase